MHATPLLPLLPLLLTTAAAAPTTVTALLCPLPDLRGPCHPQPLLSDPTGTFPTTPYILNGELVRAGVRSGAVTAVPAGTAYEVELWSGNDARTCTGTLLATFDGAARNVDVPAGALGGGACLVFRRAE